MKFIEYIKSQFVWKKSHSNLNMEEKNAYKSIDSITKSASWDNLNLSLYEHLKSAKKQSNWKFFGALDKYTRTVIIATYTLLMFLISASVFGILFAVFNQFMLTNLASGIGFFDSFMAFVIKGSLGVVCIGSPIYFALRFFSFLKDKSNLSVGKEHLFILNNEGTWSGIDENLKKGFEKAISLPLAKSWWDELLGMLKEYGKVSGDKEILDKENLFIKISKKEKISENLMN